MRFPRDWNRVAMIGLVCVCLAGNAGRGQKSQNPTPNPGSSLPDPFSQQGDPKSRGDMPPFGSNEEKQVKLREEDRQKRLVADTDKLLQLVTQLHDDVAKTDRHMLSLDVVRRADEIEKLAHSVKEREKG